MKRETGSAKRFTTILLTGLAAACAPGSVDEPAVVDHALQAVDTIVAPGDARFNRLSELVVGPDGELFAVDAGAGTILELTSDGRILRTIGGAGSGPGELQQPRSLHVGRDTLRVVDGGNGRLARFTRDGADAGTLPATPAIFSSAVAFGGDGSMLLANAAGPMLVQRVGPDGVAVDSFAPQVVPAPAVWDFGAIKTEIAEGRVPANLRNLVLPVLASDGSAWAAYQTEGVVERYNAGDSLLVRRVLEEPGFTAMREDFFRRNKEMDANQLASLAYFVTGQAVGDDLWVLLRMPEEEGAALLVIGPDAAVRSRITFPAATGIRGFALDPRSGRLHLLAWGEGAIYAATMPDGLLQ